ncbi:response regulator [Acanthopleuribacter pedis]|uniref:Response regulator n=1 Tax=Acanthopleuribacter pedis TaxID=442870 RepID=A0A8J7U3V7_9BACT|nr:response regulator [Acanthopleuribacter pedis]MBO1319169.1 response regulator [Acanthopleuribacter pedis]
MNLNQMVQLATQVFLKHAYPKGVPSAIQEMSDSLASLATKDELLAWSRLEKENGRYHLRLGNHAYPHMKLAFLIDQDQGHPVFYVDAHDSHFNLPPNVPGHEKLLALRKFNKELKKEIEAALIRENLHVFGEKPQREIKTVHRCVGMKVLAIDDEDQILDMLSIIVKSMGADFIRATSVEEGRRMIRGRGIPDLIFCDIMMPKESGFDFVAWLRKEGYSVPTYFITGLNLEKIDRDRVTAVLQKPFTAKSVMNIMKKLRKEGKKDEGQAEGTI